MHPEPGPRSVLLSAPFLIAIALLALNDHALKAAFPGVLSGKLSDVSGLFAFPLGLWATLDLLGVQRARSTQALALVAACTALGFALLKACAPARELFLTAYATVAWPTAVAPDLTDLLCLPCCALAWIYGRRHLQQELPSVTTRLRSMARVGVAGVFAVLSVATSPYRPLAPLNLQLTPRGESSLEISTTPRVYSDRPLILTLPPGEYERVTILSRLHPFQNEGHDCAAEGEVEVWVLCEWTQESLELGRSPVELRVPIQHDPYPRMDAGWGVRLADLPPEVVSNWNPSQQRALRRSEDMPPCGWFQLHVLESGGRRHRVDLAIVDEPRPPQ